jgi:hypothetical protein
MYLKPLVVDKLIAIDTSIDPDNVFYSDGLQLFMDIGLYNVFMVNLHLLKEDSST